MSDAPTTAALRVAACFAFRHIHEASEHAREQVLVALVEVLPAAEASRAQDALFALREAHRLQLELQGVLSARAAATALPVAPAVFFGVQPGEGFVPDFRLYNLTADIPGHPQGSTVSEHTLRKLGFALPPDGATNGGTAP